MMLHPLAQSWVQEHPTGGSYPNKTKMTDTTEDNSRHLSQHKASKCAIPFLLNSQMEMSEVQSFSDSNYYAQSLSKQVSRRIAKGTTTVRTVTQMSCSVFALI